MVSKFLQAAVTASQCLQLLKSRAWHGNGPGPELRAGSSRQGWSQAWCGQGGQGGLAAAALPLLAGQCQAWAAAPRRSTGPQLLHVNEGFLMSCLNSN